MEIQQLRHFLAVARYGSIGQAADAMGFSQPGLSRSIRALEEALGLALFERKARGVALTDHGRQLVTRAEVIVHEHDRALAEARAAGQLRSGDVRLGLHDVMAAIGAAEAIDRLLDANPAIGLSMDVATGPDLVERVTRAEIDIAFTLFPVERQRGELFYEPLFQLPCRICQRRGAARPIADTRSLAELIEHDWLLPGAMNLQLAFEQALEAEGLPVPAHFMRSSSLPLTLQLIQRRDLLTILPERVLALPPLAGRMETSAATAPGGMPEGGLIYRREALRIPAIRAVASGFCDFAVNFAEMPVS